MEQNKVITRHMVRPENIVPFSELKIGDILYDQPIPGMDHIVSHKYRLIWKGNFKELVDSGYSSILEDEDEEVKTMDYDWVIVELIGEPCQCYQGPELKNYNCDPVGLISFRSLA